MCRVLIGIDATHAGILTSVRSTPLHSGASQLDGTLPYPLWKLEAGSWKLALRRSVNDGRPTSGLDPQASGEPRLRWEA